MSSIDGKEKEMIDIKYIYDRLYNVSSLCLDFFHEGIRYRQRDLTGGKKKQKETEFSRYKKFNNTYISFGLNSYNHQDIKKSVLDHKWINDKRKQNLINLRARKMVHYSEFRNAQSSDYIIWDFLQLEWDDYQQPNFKLKKLNSKTSKLFFLNYLDTPYKIIKLAEAYYLEDDFKKAIHNLLPPKIVETFFDFKSLKNIVEVGCILLENKY